MSVTLEYITAIMRHHPNGGSFGDPFDFTCTLLIDGKKALIKAAAGNFSPEIKSKIEDALTQIGIEQIAYTRRGRPKKVPSKE